MDKVTKFCQNLEEQDKFLKVFQNLTKMISIYLKKNNSNRSLNFKYLSLLLQHSRQILNFTRTINEINEIKAKISTNLRNNFNVNKITDLLINVLKLLFYFFDNLSLLSEYKIISLDENTSKRTSALFSFFIDLIEIIFQFYEFYNLLKEKNKSEKNIISKDNKSESENKIEEYNKKILFSLVDISRKFADLLSSSNCSGISNFIFGVKINEVMINLCNLWSVLISILKH